jgi:hypothetical protein
MALFVITLYLVGCPCGALGRQVFAAKKHRLTAVQEDVGSSPGHTATNTPDLFRTPKLTAAGPGQY